jgi:ribonuclease-3
LGDAIVDLLAAEFLYERFPDWQEGQLTNWRANLVRSESLGAFAASLGLGQRLWLGHGEKMGGGRTRVTLLADAFEALVGAIYLDQGLDTVRGFLVPFLESQLEVLIAEARLRDAKSQLQEWSQASLHEAPMYATVQEVGPDHAKQFTVQVLIQGQVYGQGVGRSKQAAEQEAAQAALDALPAAP